MSNFDIYGIQDKKYIFLHVLENSLKLTLTNIFISV